MYRRSNTSRRPPSRPLFPYLLRTRVVDRPNQAWAADVTCIPRARGFVYLVAVIDGFSRKVLAWRLSNSLTADFIGVLMREQIRISIDGRGAWRDNVFVERPWRSINYEEVSLHAYGSVSAAQAGIARYLAFFNTPRPHASLDRRTPNSVYFESRPLAAAAQPARLHLPAPRKLSR